MSYLHPDIKSFRKDMKINAEIKIVAFGHSWTMDNNVTMWATQLKTYIEARNTNATVVNSGMSGVETPLALTSLNEKVLSLNPQYCLLCWGINDWSKSDAEYYDVATYIANMQSMIDQIQAIGCKVFIWTDGPVATSTEAYGYVGSVEDESGYGDNKFINFHEALVNIAKINGLYLIDSYQQFIDYWLGGVNIGSWYRNNLHFAQIGHDLIFKGMVKHLLTLYGKNKNGLLPN